MLGGTAKCAFCGKEFAIKAGNQIYCSKECCGKAYKQKGKEERRKLKKRVIEIKGTGAKLAEPTEPKPKADYVNTGDYLAREYIGKVITI